MKYLVLAILALLATPALAQQQPPDPAFLQRFLGAMQAQRNQALDVAAVGEAKAQGLAEDLAKAQARIKELEQNKPSDKKPK